MSGREFVDPIIEEVRRVRQAHASKFNYDVDAIVRDLREQQKKSGITFITLRLRISERKDGAA